jgi:hypothetical protein
MSGIRPCSGCPIRNDGHETVAPGALRPNGVAFPIVPLHGSSKGRLGSLAAPRDGTIVQRQWPPGRYFGQPQFPPRSSRPCLAVSTQAAGRCRSQPCEPGGASSYSKRPALPLRIWKASAGFERGLMGAPARTNVPGATKTLRRPASPDQDSLEMIRKLLGPTDNDTFAWLPNAARQRT